MKIITRNIVWICCLLCMTVSCSNDTDALIADGDEVVVHLSFSPNQSSTRVSLQESAESLDLTTHWENGDEVDLYVMYDGKVEHIGKVPIKGISEDGKDCIISYKKPKVVEDGLTEEYTLMGIVGAATSCTESEVYCNASLQRVTFEKFKVPAVVSIVTGFNQTNAVFKPYGVYEILHISNTSDKSISFSLKGFEASPSWFRLQGAIRFSDGIYVNESEAVQPYTIESDAVTIPSQGSDAIVSWYLPNGNLINDAVISATIDGKTVKSSNKKSSDVELQLSHAYHMYATWDGAELNYDEDKIEIPESFVYPVESYSLSEDGTILYFWRGDEKVVNLKADPAFSELTTICEHAFGGALELQALVIPQTVTTLGYWPDRPGYYAGILGVRSDLKLREIIIDEDNPNYSSKDGLIYNKDKTILYEASLALKSFAVANSVKEIYDYAFAFNERVTNVVLPNSLEIIGKSAFAFCENLKNLQFPSSIRVIGEDAFLECFAFTEINLPNSVEEIGVGAFKRSMIKNFVFPQKVTEIPDQVFEGCTQLESVTLPATATGIGIESFDYCQSLKTIDIPETVTTIGYLGFGNCRSLASITIPKNVTSIDRYAFFNCTNLKTVYALPETPPTVAEDTFDGMPLAQCKLYVYPSSKSKYIQADGWKDFGIIKTIENQ